MTDQYHVHSLEGKPTSEWQPLAEHLRNVAKRAGEFAAVFQSSDWAMAAGWLHDLGKYSKEFQDYLKKANDIDASIETERGSRLKQSCPSLADFTLSFAAKLLRI
ncbi:MAG: CRISPR-associated endonuclease Cas3'' [Syntrophobacteraceae bacterium]